MEATKPEAPEIPLAIWPHTHDKHALFQEEDGLVFLLLSGRKYLFTNANCC
jgi:hypothetical protein